VKPVLLISGAPRVGKTTLVKKLVHASALEYGGFYTEETRMGAHRTGFQLVTLQGTQKLFASTDFKAPHYFKIGNYGVDVAVLETLGISAIVNAVQERRTVVIDEIGPMQTLSLSFRQIVENILNDGSIAVLGTIAIHDVAFLNKVRQHERVRVVHVTPENRDNWGQFGELSSKI
jgi:nucleoside-triphosphatase